MERNAAARFAMATVSVISKQILRGGTWVAANGVCTSARKVRQPIQLPSSLIEVGVVVTDHMNAVATVVLCDIAGLIGVAQQHLSALFAAVDGGDSNTDAYAKRTIS